MRLLLPLFALLAALLQAAPPAHAFDLPGLQRDVDQYERSLTRRFPAGATPAQRSAAEQRAQAAERAGNWAAAATAWEERVAGGEASAEQWLALAQAQLKRTPPEATRALQAAWQNFQMVPAGAPELPSLLAIAEALGRLDRPAQQIEALQEVIQRAPDNQAYRRQLAEARRAAGMAVARVRTDGEAEPARACLSFTIAPAKRDDWHPGDWVRADPPLPSLAVTREGDELCVTGLPYGRTTRLVLRAGLPAEDNLKLSRDTPVNIAIANRAARIIFDTSAFLLPRSQEQAVSVATVNLSTLKLRVVRVTERNLVPVGRDWRPGDALESWSAENFAESWGRVVWEGTAQLAPLAANTVQRSLLRLPEALRTSGPGLFVLIASPADGTRAATAALPLIATDLGLTAWRSAAGLAAQVRALGAARPLAGVQVRLMATNNDILAEAVAGPDGLVRFPGALLAGAGPMAPKALQAFQGDDLVQLNLDQAAFDLSDRGAGGMEHPGPLDAFVWLDRGIYRPGETVNAAALLRDASGAPADFPARFRVRRPGGQVFAEAVPAREAGAAILWPIPLSAGAQVGVWTIEVLADPNAPPVGSATFRVDAFVPERLAVTAGPAPGPLVVGQPLAIPLNARFLYGAPGAGLTGSGELQVISQRGLEAFPGYVFGAADEQFAPEAQQVEFAALDAVGNGTLTLSLDKAPDTTRPMRAQLTVSIGEPGGRASATRIMLPVQAQDRLIGVKPAFADDAIDADTEAAFDILALNRAQAATPATLRLRLVRETPSWRLMMRNRTARYETVWTDEAVDSREIRPTATAARYARRLPFGRYRLEVTEAGSLALTTYRFRAGWAPSASVDVPDKVDVSADQRQYAPGASARIRITPPFAGTASVAVLTDRLVSVRDVEVPAAGAEVTIPVDAAWGPGAYVAVTVFRHGEARNAGTQPLGRALGLAWLQLAPDSRRIGIAINSPERILPRQRVTIPLRLTDAGQGAMLTLAAVDEGILRLTNFATPDPIGHFMGKRRLGVDIRDDYGRLIAPADGEAATLRQGGDGLGDQGKLEIPQRNVSLFSGPIAVAPDGTASVTLDIPDFAGELRLMAVAWSGSRSGAVSKPMTVRDPVVAEAILPRFLAPGDEARLPLLLHNLDLPEGEITATLTTQGAIALVSPLAGPVRHVLRLANGARGTPFSTLRATGAGEGVLRLAVTGPNNFTAAHEYRITVRSSRPIVTEVASSEVAAGREISLAPPLDRYIPGTWRASVSVGGPTRYDVAGMLRALEAYPFACLEQSSSKLMAMAAYPDTPNRAGLLQRGVEGVLLRQRFDGLFGLWSSGGSAEPWLGSYAVEALLRAKAAGATVPEAALEDALKAILTEVDGGEPNTPEERAAQAYRLHVLGMAGRHRLGAARRLMEQLEALPTPLAKAQLASAFARAGDRARAEAAFTAALAAPARRFWAFDYGTTARDSLAVLLLVQESGLLAERIPALVARLPGADFTPASTSTQDQAWAIATAQALGRGSQPPSVSLNGQAVQPAGFRVSLPLNGPAKLKNTGRATFWESVAVTGIPKEALPAATAGMRVTRRFFGLDGKPLETDQLRQNQVFVMLLEGRADDRESHRALVQQGLPAGWEIVTRLGPGEVTGMPWLGELTEAVAQPALDDRFAAALDLTAEAPAFRLAVRLRAVTAGRFELPGADLADMYRPAVFARASARRVQVTPAE